MKTADVVAGGADDVVGTDVVEDGLVVVSGRVVVGWVTTELADESFALVIDDKCEG